MQDAAQGNGRLLIFDDDSGVGNVIRIIGTSCGLESRWVTAPADFFQALADWQPTHVALDLIMPEIDGVEVLIKLASVNCTAKIIVTSGMGSRVLEAAARSAGEHGLNVIGTLAKPFLASALRNLLGESARADSSGESRDLQAPASRSFELTALEFRRALANGELGLVYQPKIECATGMLSGFEALARWFHPQRGCIMPDKFIPFAEKNGLIDVLTDNLLEIGLGWFAANFISPASHFADASGGRVSSGVSLSVNLSALSLNDVTLVDRMAERCQRHQVPTGRVILELTETSAMVNPVASLDMLTRMRIKGFQLSIDDFGTGYSSMVQLVRLPFSEIKVDKSFVMTVAQSAESRAVVRSVVELGRTLGLKSVAEGVEDHECLDFLREIKCDFAQGFWISRPMGGDAVQGWIQDR